MANNEVKLTIKVDDKGTLTVVAKESKKAAKETEKLQHATEKTNKARGKFNKGEKGVAQAGMNTTKSFSKMRDAMGGSSGLVGAYATLAANVFALTAAFGVLQRAAEFTQLTQSVEFFGNAAGRNLNSVVDRLKDVTNQALSTENALRSTALAVSSGFRTDQIEELAIVADGASKALGRDLNDAFDRLVRGAAKLEPEILDELGIMVRLDDAAQSYAETLGKSVSQLTAFEKRQAFLNATLAAGQKQFGGLRDSVDTNPYNQLAASMNNLAKSGVTIINDFLRPLIDFLASNQEALGGALLLFASTISRTMLPALADQAALAGQGAAAMRDNASANLASLEATKSGAKGYNVFVAGLKDGTKSLDDATEGHKGLDNAIRGHKAAQSRLGEETSKNTDKHNIQRAAISSLVAKKAELTKATLLGTRATAYNTAANSLNALSAGQLGVAFSGLKSAIVGFHSSLVGAQAGATGFQFSLALLRTGIFATVLSLRFLATAFFALLGPIGLLLSIAPMLYSWFQDKFFPEDETKKKFEKVREGLDIITRAEKQYREQNLKGLAAREAGFKAALGVQYEVTLAIQTSMTEEKKLAKASFDSLKLRKEEIQSLITVKQARIDEIRAKKAAGTETIKERGELFELIKGVKSLEMQYRDTSSSLGSTFLKLKGIGPESLATIKDAAGRLKNSPELSQFMSPAIKNLDMWISHIESGKYNTEQFERFISQLGVDAEKGTAFLEGLGGAVSNLRSEQAKLANKAATPYDNILKAAKGVLTEFTNLNDVTPEVRKRLEELGIEVSKEGFKKAFGGDTKEAVTDYVTSLESAIEVLRSFPAELQKNKIAQQQINKVSGLSTAALKESFKIQQDGFNLRQDEINSQRVAIVSSYTDENGLVTEQGQILLDNQMTRQHQLNLEQSMVTEGTKLQKIAIQEAQAEQQILNLLNEKNNAIKEGLSLRQKIAETELKLQNIEGPDRKSALTPQQELQLFNDFRTEREQAADDELENRKAIIRVETTINKAKLLLIREQLRALKQLDATTESQINSSIASLGGIEEQKLDNAKKQNKLAKDLIKLEGKERKQAILDSFIRGIEGSKPAFQGLLDNMSFGEDGAIKDNPLKSILEDGTAREKLDVFKGYVGEFVETLKTLGPEGEFIATLATASFAIADSWITVGETFQETGNKALRFAAVAAAVGQSIGQINSIMQAGYSKTIAKIDEQLQAEKKRDGKSSESVARMTKLEKSKEAVQRKAFETNKKMLMAQTIANTAAGIASILPLMVPPTTGIATALMAVVGAMGAAQLAVIAGTSFQGGGGSASTATPSVITAGKRDGSVDLAKSSGGAGELGYLRGESGTGGPENFKRGFAGVKYRAEGGNAGIVVGEQGPELFVPETPGRVVANDDVGGGGMQNVNFSINAVDAAGVEDLLVNQRGNIIGMLREASNSYGQPFMEKVNTQVYSGGGQGIARYGAG